MACDETIAKLRDIQQSLGRLLAYNDNTGRESLLGRVEHHLETAVSFKDVEAAMNARPIDAQNTLVHGPEDLLYIVLKKVYADFGTATAMLLAIREHLAELDTFIDDILCHQEEV
jgi:hypothetical protein